MLNPKMNFFLSVYLVLLLASVSTSAPTSSRGGMYGVYSPSSVSFSRASDEGTSFLVYTFDLSGKNISIIPLGKTYEGNIYLLPYILLDSKNLPRVIGWEITSESTTTPSKSSQGGGKPNQILTCNLAIFPSNSISPPFYLGKIVFPWSQAATPKAVLSGTELIVAYSTGSQVYLGVGTSGLSSERRLFKGDLLGLGESQSGVYLTDLLNTPKGVLVVWYQQNGGSYGYFQSLNQTFFLLSAANPCVIVNGESSVLYVTWNEESQAGLYLSTVTLPSANAFGGLEGPRITSTSSLSGLEGCMYSSTSFISYPGFERYEDQTYSTTIQAMVVGCIEMTPLPYSAVLGGIYSMEGVLLASLNFSALASTHGKGSKGPLGDPPSTTYFNPQVTSSSYDPGMWAITFGFFDEDSEQREVIFFEGSRKLSSYIF